MQCNPIHLIHWINKFSFILCSLFIWLWLFCCSRFHISNNCRRNICLPTSHVFCHVMCMFTLTRICLVFIMLGMRDINIINWRKNNASIQFDLDEPTTHSGSDVGCVSNTAIFHIISMKSIKSKKGTKIDEHMMLSAHSMHIFFPTANEHTRYMYETNAFGPVHVSAIELSSIWSVLLVQNYFRHEVQKEKQNVWHCELFILQISRPILEKYIHLTSIAYDMWLSNAIYASFFLQSFNDNFFFYIFFFVCSIHSMWRSLFMQLSLLIIIT